MSGNTSTGYSGISQTPLSPSDIDRKLAENETLLQEWKILFMKTDKSTTISSIDAITHTQLRKKINDNLALLASHLKTFFALTVSVNIVIILYCNVYAVIFYIIWLYFIHRYPYIRLCMYIAFMYAYIHICKYTNIHVYIHIYTESGERGSLSSATPPSPDSRTPCSTLSSRFNG